MLQFDNCNCCVSVCMYVYIYSPDMDIQKYTVTMKIIVNSVKISSPIGVTGAISRAI